MDYTLIATIVGAILAVVSGVFGAKWKAWHNKALEVVALAKEVIDAIEDNDISPEEEKRIADRVKGILGQTVPEE